MRLSRGATGAQARPVRMVHLGLGAFHRAHQAWFTAMASDAPDWGIAAFSGRRPEAADVLAAQDGLYTLIERAAEGDRARIMDPLSRAYDGADVAALAGLVANPGVSIVTLTITEVGYGASRTKLTDTLRQDRDILRARFADAHLRGDADPRTALGRLALGLEARRRADGGGITIVSCDNLPDNGGVTRDVLRMLLEPAGGAALDQFDELVGVASASVDRITPRATDADRADALRLTGYSDAAPVVTEPFADWVIANAFQAPRPDWESAGVRIVEDLEPFERRKLWMLNGAHTLLATAGRARGHETVDAAMNDSVVSGWVEQLWDDAIRHLPAELDAEEYRTRLRSRFANGRIRHLLDQIALDTETKLRMRVIPLVRAERAEGRYAEAATRAIASWVAASAAEHDAGPEGARAALATLDAELADDETYVAVLAEVVREERAAGQAAGARMVAR
ncbi:mannitol dehydrogenase family protein [Microbacterium sp. BG28]|uniref:mannitol dehydrogenase family protein n=1 Tax=Microbacterium sp. BG28 TaxID=3097356 RepID=UPI002A59C06A|nr:mannitol dehydrogenase family protein [Microbacterium sp. BG28]MDY0830056.1 mannitol dehydrogenase family protein [Microbacterium sp. BG28]